jgi:hypothetical protein
VFFSLRELHVTEEEIVFAFADMQKQSMLYEDSEEAD